MNAVKLNTISFFSGAMGLDLGLKQAGLNINIGQDIDPVCAKTAEANGHKIICGDIRDMQPQDILGAANLNTDEVFLICGGPPCQSFSTAGKRKGIHDSRGSLFMDFIRMLDYIRPRFFIMENVKGMISAPADDGNKSCLAVNVILNGLSKLNYKTVYGLLDAVNYGVPQFRERFVIIGSRDNENIFLPLPTHFQMHQNPAYRWRTVRDAIKDIEDDNTECVVLSEERRKYMQLIPEGGNWRNIPEDMLPNAMGGAYKSEGGKVGFYRRLSYSQPSPTITTSPAQKATMLYHPCKDRVLSVKEYARLQDFPDNWIFARTTTEKYRQIGNAVPVGLGRAIGMAVLSAADNSALIHTKRTRGTSVHEKIKSALELRL